MGRGLAIALCFGAALLLAAAPAQARRADCGRAAAPTVARSKLLRVFVVRPEPGVRRYYACMRHGSRPVLVAEADNSPGGYDPPRERVERFLLRGVYVTSLSTSCQRHGAGCEYAVWVSDVKRRRDVGGTNYESGEVETLVASARGEAAFLVHDTLNDTYVVDKLDDFGVSERDRGPHLRGLELHGRRIAWLNGDERRSESIAHVRRCGPAAAESALIGRTGRVYQIDPKGEEGERTEYYACLFSGGRPFLLGNDLLGSTAYSYLSAFQVVGRYAGWFEYQCYHGCTTALHVADLRGRTVRVGEGTFAESFLLNGRGFAAIIVAHPPTPTPRRLYAFDSSGQREIDSGDELDPQSVALAPDAITWLHGAETRREELR